MTDVRSEPAVRVALDLSHTRLSGAGTARYAHELRAALLRRTDVDLVTLGEGTAVPRGPGARRYATVLAHDVAWYPVRGRAAARRVGASVYHVPLPRGPLAPASHASLGPRTVVTVHDLVALRFPETMGTWNRAYTRATLARVARAADLVVTVSQDTADDVSALLGVPAARIRVAYGGVHPRWFERAAPPAGVRPYVLFVGTPEPRKNLHGLVAAMRLLRAAGRGEELVVAGGEGWGSVGITGADVRFTGRVSDAELHALYAGAACVVLPSLHEGFGLPALEAMAAGAPVVVARAGALPEICGDAALYVDPTSASDIAAGIERALLGGAPAADVRRARAARFSWDAAAERMAATYRELA